MMAKTKGKTNRPVVYEDFSIVCRVCLSQGDIQPFEIKLLEVFKIILNNTENEVEEKLPQNICKTCSVQLQDLESFIRKCRNNEETLKTIYLERNNNYNDTTDGDSDVEDKFDLTQVKYEGDQDPVKVKKEISEDNSAKKPELKKPTKKIKAKPFSAECKLCNKICRGKTAFANHMQAHKERKRFLCNICGKDFIKNSHLERHIRAHMGIKPYECKECGKHFGQNYELKGHLLRHTNEKSFECNFCDKKFTTKKYLEVHSRTHSVVKPYQCSHCEKQFCQKNGLNNHILSHTGEKPHKCTLCEKTFFQSAHLKDHLRIIHSGEKPYLCTYCGKEFAYNYTWKVHLKQHTGEAPSFACLYCNKGFHYTSNLKRHIHRNHSNVKQSRSKNNNENMPNEYE